LDVALVERHLHGLKRARTTAARQDAMGDVSKSGSVGVVTPDPHHDGWKRVADAILTVPGELGEDERRAIAAGGRPAELATLLDKVRLQAYKVVEADVAGLSDDAAIEAILAAALGAADERRRAALEAIG
jgi:hypothetical protein